MNDPVSRSGSICRDYGLALLVVLIALIGLSL
jgi:hypothetical protein